MLWYRVFAVHSWTGDIYRYAEATGEWTKAGNLGKMFVASGGVDSRVYGLFLSREILGITGMTITETGEEGKWARFEISVPRENYRWVSD